MATFTRSDELEGAEFVGANLRGARFVESDLSGVVMRGVEASGLDIDAPWLVHGEPLHVNGVDVVAFVEAELDRRFPGRADRRAPDPEGLRAAWAALERTWAATLARAAAMPSGAVDVSVDGEWSFAQTLRHLVHATDIWLRRGVLEIEQPFHPLGLMTPEPRTTPDASLTAPRRPTPRCCRPGKSGSRWCATSSRASHRTSSTRRARIPHEPEVPETTRSCLHVILEEEWEHHRFAVRDLDAIEAKPAD